MEELRNKNEVTSLELLNEINRYREMEYNYKIENNIELGKVEKKNGRFTELTHDNLLKILRDEFNGEIGQGNIYESSYVNSQNKNQLMYIISLEYCKLILYTN